MPPFKFKNTKPITLTDIFENFHHHVTNINESKIFAGLMIVILNIASKFVNFKFGPTAEKYLKYTFSRQILVFAMTWMGTRDIYIATILTLVFILFFDVLFNEDSQFCILPDNLKEYYNNLDEEEQKIDDKELANAFVTIEKYRNQKQEQSEANTLSKTSLK
jgi:hypothetical protein